MVVLGYNLHMKTTGKKSGNRASFGTRKACYEEARYTNYRASMQLEGITPGKFSPLTEDRIESAKAAVFAKYGINK